MRPSLLEQLRSATTYCMHRRAGWPIGALAGCLMIAFALGRGSVFGTRTPPGPVVGRLLPPMRVDLVNDTGSYFLHDLLAGESQCFLVVAISTACTYCDRMRFTWPRQVEAWSDSVGSNVGLIWIAPDRPEKLAEFVDGFKFDNVKLASLSRRPNRAMRKLGVYGTPTAYLLDRLGRLRIGVMGDRLPPVRASREVCQSATG